MSERLQRILHLLHDTKENDQVDSIDDQTKDILVELGPREGTDGPFRVSRDDRISLALEAISLGAEAESVIEWMTWKDFEGFIARVLNENDFKCVESFRRKGGVSVKGMEVDVIGVKGNTIVAVDAKMWGARSGKSSALMSAAQRQKERTSRLPDQIEKLSKKLGNMKPGSYTIVPVLVTWLVEDVDFHEGVPIVPIFQLNSFLLDFADYGDMTVSYEARLQHVP